MPPRDVTAKKRLRGEFYRAVGQVLSVAMAAVLGTNVHAWGAGPPGCKPTKEYEESAFRRVVSDLRTDRTLTIEGSDWDNTLVKNCVIRGVDGDGLVIRNVTDLVVTGCTIGDVTGSGIRLSSSGGTSSVTLDGNSISNVGENGISAAQRAEQNVDHKDLKLINNRIERTGTLFTEGYTHGIYVQTTEFLIEGNVVAGPRDGNGISVRSSGVIRCNRVEGRSASGKPAIRYYSDHVSGPGKTLVVEANTISSATVGIDLAAPVARKGMPFTTDHVVSTFVIRDNRIEAPSPFTSASRYRAAPFSVELDPS
jgi:hypothetical protein